MKNIKTKLPLFAALFVAAPVLVNCGGGGGNVDATKSQLYVHNFQAGFGGEWLINAKNAFEEATKDRSYEDGKKGTQIIISSDTKVWTGQDIVTDKATVFFAEMYNQSIPEFAKNGYLKDVSEIITTENEFDNNKKIEDKMKASQKDYYKVQGKNDTERKYYGVPHYYGTYGFNVNTKIFDDKCFYFKDGYDKEVIDYPYSGLVSDLFIEDISQKKSAGPDGKYGTYDDGFPITFNEFYVLCDYMSDGGVTPYAINENSFGDYAGCFTASLLGSLQGEDQFMLNFTFGDGIDDAKVADYIETPTSSIEQKSINLDTGYNIIKSKSRLEALQFIDQLFGKNKGSAKWREKVGVSSHTDTQNTFIYGSLIKDHKEVGLLIDGSWWQNEAKETFKTLKDRKGDEFDITKRDYTIMPFPRVNKEDAYAPTLTDALIGAQFMSSDATAVEYKLGCDFLKFLNSDAQLSSFSKTTNTPRALNYQMNTEDYNGMSKYGQHIMTIHSDSESKVLFPFASNSKYTSNMSYFRSGLLFTDDKGSAAKQFKEGNAVTPESLFESIYKFVKKGVWNQ